MSLTLPLMYFQTGADLSKITHHEVNYPEDFVQQAWLQPEIELFVVYIARGKGTRREIKGGMAVLFLPVFRPTTQQNFQPRLVMLCASLMSYGDW